MKDQTALALSNRINKSIIDENIPLSRCREQGDNGRDLWWNLKTHKRSRT